MPRTMPCAICHKPMHKGRGSKPEGIATHNACRKGKPGEPKSCISCSGIFTGKESRCNPCRYERAKANAKGPCSECDKPAIAKGFCSTHYASAHNAQHGRKRTLYTKSCCHCQGAFTTTTRGTLFCSLGCAQRSRNGWSTGLDMVIYQPPPKAPKPVPHIKTTNRLTCGICRVCGSSFVSFHTDVTCSKECYAAKKREARHVAKQRRRALKKEAYVAPVYRKRVFEADGYRCHICNKMTKKTAVVPHPMAPTIDHLVPLAKGGTHEPINCRTAHFMCNAIKGDRLAGDQLLLFAA